MMKAAIESLKKRATGLRAEAARYDAAADQMFKDAESMREQAAECLAEAEEYDRIVVAVYGEGSK